MKKIISCSCKRCNVYADPMHKTMKNNSSLSNEKVVADPTESAERQCK